MKLLFPLWLLIASSHLNPYFASYKRRVDLLQWVHQGSIQANATEQEAKLAAIWALRESGANPLAVNVDSGACGVMQLLGAGRMGFPCSVLMDDPAFSVEIWIRGMRRVALECKTTSLRVVLEAHSWGSCKHPKTAIVAFRCWQAEVPCP